MYHTPMTTKDKTVQIKLPAEAHRLLKRRAVDTERLLGELLQSILVDAAYAYNGLAVDAKEREKGEGEEG